MGMSYLEAARIMMGGAGNVGPKPDHVTVNGTYYAEDDDLDGYTQFVVAIPLSGTTFTDNGSYTADVGGWSSVTVNVKTWKDEYDAMKECCDKVSEAILDNWPDDPVNPKPDEPWPDPEDPTKPTIEEAIPIISGYIFPPGTPIRDLEAVTGGNPITDTTTGVTVEIIHVLDGDSAWYPDEHQYFNAYSKIRGVDYFPQIEPYTSTCYQTWYMKITNGTTTYTWSPGWDQSQQQHPVYDCEGYDQLVSASIDPATGFVEWIIEATYPGYSPTSRRYIGTLSDLIGYGADGHTYKVGSGSNAFTPETTPT